MSGTKRDSQQKSSSTEQPPELETPQEVTGWDDLPGSTPQKPDAEAKAEELPTSVVSSKAGGIKEALADALVAQQGMAFPQVRVVENGKETVGELDVGLVGMVVQLGQLGQLAKIRKALEREHYKGKIDTREIPVTDQYQFIDLVEDYPNTAWISFFVINHGPNTAKIQINNLYETWLKIRKGETRKVDHSKADERIKQLAYQCAPGETALLEIEAEY